jgi:hypothetical protein
MKTHTKTMLVLLGACLAMLALPPGRDTPLDVAGLTWSSATAGTSASEVVAVEGSLSVQEVDATVEPVDDESEVRRRKVLERQVTRLEEVLASIDGRIEALVATRSHADALAAMGHHRQRIEEELRRHRAVLER